MVLQATVVGCGGEVLLLDMGDPVRITDVAQRLIRHSGQRVKIVYTGLPEGEKLHEDLISDTEQGDRPFHPKITHVTVPALAPDDAKADLRETDEQTRIWMARIAYVVPDDASTLAETLTPEPTRRLPSLHRFRAIPRPPRQLSG